YLNLGHMVTNLSIIESGLTRVVRDVFIAGNTFTRAVMKALQYDYPKAEEVKKACGLLLDAEEKEKALQEGNRDALGVSQAVAGVMKDQGGGNIINISSIMGFRGSDEYLHPAVPYNSTKAAINALTMNLAVKLAPFNIRVNAIAPGFFRTDMMAYIETPEFKESHDKAMELVPMRRFGDVDDMKGVVVFLASDASAYMTGHVLVNDGGFLAK
ncbi:MAG TPA: SDR family oxidoreductase, partial [Deltaproteobacteria bacterium]|nr:SDR family oxidoreductase [Deltaproteobacteria bacterium]